MTDTLEIETGKEIIRGKTKKVSEVKGNEVMVVVESFDSITAGDGAKKDVIDNKAVFANITTCNVFELLKKHGIPTAFERRIDDTRFLGYLCDMLPLEVVVRRVALGSYLKRNPGVEKGTVFETLTPEFYLKTNDRIFGPIRVPECDDPYLVYEEGYFYIYNPNREIKNENCLLSAPEDMIVPEFQYEKVQIEAMAIKVFEVLEEAWKGLGFILADFKIEFGYDSVNGELVIADVIDNDSWRVIDSQGEHIDKQLYREGKDLATVKGMYAKVAELTKQFV
jgi:phosphoribosylaminoimidazole-succinocarboxamide synthase